MNIGSPAAAKVLGALGLLAVAGLGWVLAIGPQTSQLSATREQVAQIRDSNAALATQLAGLQKQAKQLDETRSTARRLARKFPATADQPGLFEQVTAAAVDAGIGPNGVTTLAPTPPTVGQDGTTTGAGQVAASPAGTLARQTVTVTVTGTYEQTQQLLTNLEHMQRAYLVGSVALSGGADGGGYTTTITGDMFVMSPVAEPDAKAVQAATTGSTSTDPEE
jgi:Tfp pilus assembly protein PilO